ncbi:hypothetical protein F511_46461 [Dorcoceras hygrometricum]|uniref:Uncharacterized protein n=1 Tax=Dorcoceras hygrometricum TaxID=472368 RepID=A0A2Z6ZTG0_9LAMI|nr:hypothetical protein F511_46461 [Dorcoceras hygrometricum]
MCGGAPTLAPVRRASCALAAQREGTAARTCALNIGHSVAPRPRSSSRLGRALRRASAALVARLGRACHAPPPRLSRTSGGHLLLLVARRRGRMAPLVEGWPTRRRLLLRTSGAGCVLAARCARDAMRRWSAPLCAAFDFVDGGGRRPVAAPASFRRCRDGWSDFF